MEVFFCLFCFVFSFFFSFLILGICFVPINLKKKLESYINNLDLDSENSLDETTPSFSQ